MLFAAAKFSANQELY